MTLPLTEDEIAAITERRGWSEAAREACRAFEREHDVEVVSIEHHTTWVDRAEKAEAKVEALTAERDAQAILIAELRDSENILHRACDHTYDRAEKAEADNAALRKTLAEADAVVAHNAECTGCSDDKIIHLEFASLARHRSRLTPDPERER